MNTGILITFIIIGGVVCGEVLSCDSCGRECAAACGTRQFRTCCFNYLRKRAAPLHQFPVDPNQRLEFWLAKSRKGNNIAPLFEFEANREPLTIKDVDLLVSNQRNNQNDRMVLRDDSSEEYDYKSSM